MVVKIGYEETKSKRFPDGWRFDYLENLGTISSGTTPLRSAEERYYRNGTIYWVKTMDLTNTDILFTEELITKTALDETSLKIYPIGTVLVAMYGGFNQIGRTGILKISATVNQAITAIRTDPKVMVPEYLINFLNHHVSHWKNVASSSRKDPNITSYDIKKFPITFPDIREQQAIAAALSDVDALIASLDRLIAKKCDIKQATMQQLLTGRTRLAGFSGAWEVKKIGEIGKPYGGLSGKSKEDFIEGKHPYIPFLNIMNNPVIDTNYFDFVNIRPNESQNKAMKGDLFFNGSSETPEEVGMCSVLNEDVADLYLNSFCFGFRLNNALEINNTYLVYYFRSSVGRQLFYSLAQGATRYNLSKSNFLKMEIYCPKLVEQQAIATVLTDMDVEIVALERKREKTRALKQAMMQELLTGKTRLL